MRKRVCALVLCLLLPILAACENVKVSISFGDDASEQPSLSTTGEQIQMPGGTDPLATSADPEDTLLATAPAATSSAEAEAALALEDLWFKLSGCWAGEEGRFVYFTYNDGEPAFLSGVWENPIPYRRDPAAVSALNDLGNGLYTMSLTYPPVSEDAADSQDLQPLRYTLMLDISELEQGSVTVEAPEDTLRSYSFGGYSYDDAYDASNNIQYAGFDQMQEFWLWLNGYWNGSDGKFVCFDSKDSNTLLFMQGIWDSGTRGWGELEKAMSGYMDIPMIFVVYYPPVSNELDGDLPGQYVEVYVDHMEVETHRNIYVKIGEDGAWEKYSFAGHTEAEAYPN